MARRTTWLLAVILGGLVASCGVIQSPFLPEGVTRSTGTNSTPGWKPGLNVSASVRYGVFLKRETDGAGALYIRHKDLPGLWRHDPAMEKLARAGLDAWDSASGTVHDCDDDQDPKFWSENRKALEPLLLGDESVLQVGEYFRSFAISPSRTKVAVLSADGPRHHGLLSYPGLGGSVGPPLGPNYHQVYSVPDLVPIGSPVRLGGTLHLICWSADDDFVIYVNTEFRFVDVVRMNQGDGQ